LEKLFTIIKEKIEPFVRVVWLTGSFARENNIKNDIDLVIVVPEDYDELMIESKLEDIHRTTKLDTTFFHEKNVIKRANHNDYLLGSLLEDEKYLFGDREFLYKNKELIFSKQPNKDSINFNFIEALRNYDMALITFHNFRYFYRSALLQTSSDVNEIKKIVLEDSFDFEIPDSCKSYDLELAKGYLLQTLRNCTYALGYYFASQLLEKVGKTITLKYLMENNDLYKHLYTYQKTCRHNRIINPNTVEELIIVTYNLLNGKNFEELK
jgi:predicted nucleotidyltransferase